jgi:hypothetical protein
VVKSLAADSMCQPFALTLTVYVAAFALDQRQSAASQGKPYGLTPGLGELPPIEDGFLVLTQKGIQEDFGPDLTTEEQMIMVATQVPTQGAALASTISAPAWRNKPTWFVIASNDRMISPRQEKDSAEKMNAKTLTLPTSHCLCCRDRRKWRPSSAMLHRISPD